MTLSDVHFGKSTKIMFFGIDDHKTSVFEISSFHNGKKKVTIEINIIKSDCTSLELLMLYIYDCHDKWALIIV